jgi:hypothetical protein
MNLIDKYIAEVGKHLPRRQRADIEAEIRSTLEDMLEERKAFPEADSEAAVIELLKEYGDPRTVAESYIGPRYIVGPRLYPQMELVAKIVVSALFLALLLSFSFGVVRDEMTSLEISRALVEFFIDYIGAAFAALGNVILAFAVLERVLPAQVTKGFESKWDPAQLAKEPDPDQVKIGERVVEIFFTLAFLIVFNFFPDKVGLYIFTGDESFFIPLLTEAFFRYLPWWSALGVAQIALDFALLGSGTWTRTTRLVSLALRVATVILVIFMLMGPAIIGITPEILQSLPLEIEPEKAETIAGFVLIPFLIALLIATSIEAFQTASSLWNAPRRAPFEVKR